MPLTIPEYITIRTAAGATAAFLSPSSDNLKDCWIDNELNGKCTLEFSVPLTSNKWQYFTDAYRIYAGGREFIILNPDAAEISRDGRKAWGTVTAHESWVRLGKEYVDPAGISNDPNTPDPPPLAVVIVSGGNDLSGGLYEVGSAGHALYAILQGTGWSVGTVDVTGTHDLETEKISILENINKIQEIWGGYIVWDSINKTVSLRDETTWAPYTGYQIRYAKNLKGITRTDDYNIITKLYPFGENDLNIGSVNGGVIYITNNTYTDEVLEGIWVNQDLKTAQAVMDEGTKYLAKVCKPRHNYQVKQVDLRTLSGYAHEDFDLGHMVDVIDSELGIDDQARIIRYKYNVFQPWQCELEVGDPIEKVESKWENSQAMVKYLNSIKNSKGELFTPVYLVDESITRQKIANAAIDATKLSTKIIILLDDAWTDNSPSTGSVSWNQHNLYYNGTEYVITAGNTSQKYIYWDGVSNTYSTSVAEPTLTDGQFIIAVNNGGLHDTVWDKGYAREFIGSAFIADAAIKTAHIADAQIVDAHIANITANKITSGQILAYLVEIIGQGGYFRLVGDGLKAYSVTGELKAHFGYYETLAALLAAFTRASTAYLSDGSSVASGVPRYEYARQPAPVWQDTFDTDQLSQYTSGGDTPATWAVSGGVLTGTGGSHATLIKNDLLLQDCEIVVTCDQAQAAGIVARYQDNNNYYLLGLVDDSGTVPTQNLQLYKRVGGTFTLLDSADVTWPRGTSKQIKFSCKGSLLEAYFDGVKVISVTDTTFTGGGVGLRNNSSTAFRVLDFSVYHVQQGVMVEEGTTNVCPYSEELDNATWNKANVTVTPNATTAPNGTATADLLAATAGVSSNVWRNLTVSSKVLYTVSAFVKRNNNDRFKILAYDTVGAANVAGGNWNVDTNGNITAASIQIGSGTIGYEYIGGGWYRIWMTFTTPSTGLRVYLFVDEWSTSSQGNAGYVWGVQVEQKAYKTSYMKTVDASATRAAEVLTVPTAGLFSVSNGTWEQSVYVDSVAKRQVANQWPTVFHIPKAAGTTGIWVYHENDTAEWALQTQNDAGTASTGTCSDSYTPDGSHRFSVVWNSSEIALLIDGVRRITISNPNMPSGFAANAYVGSYTGSTHFLNTVHDDIRISNIARADSDILEQYNSGLPLSVDESTTLLMSMDGTLQPTVRGFGLWSKNGRFILQDPVAGQGIEVWDGATRRVLIGRLDDGTIGQEIVGGAIYGSTIKSGGKTDTDYAILRNTAQPFTVVKGGKEALVIFSETNGGVITIRNPSADVNCGVIKPTEAYYGANGIKIQGTSGSGSMPVALVGSDIWLDASGEANYYATTGGHWFYGNLTVNGNLSCTGTKPAIQQTENYGRRAMYARESPNLKFIEETVLRLTAGECRIELDPIFLETIEPHTEQTPWSVFCTPYADTGLYVAEIGENYIIIRERNGGASDSYFSWSMSAFRKGYAHLRMEEFESEGDVLTSNWEDELL